MSEPLRKVRSSGLNTLHLKTANFANFDTIDTFATFATSQFANHLL